MTAGEMFTEQEKISNLLQLQAEKALIDEIKLNGFDIMTEMKEKGILRGDAARFFQLADASFKLQNRLEEMQFKK